MRVLGADGQAVAVVGVSRDVTDRKSAEEALVRQMREIEETREAERRKSEQLERLMRELEQEGRRAEQASRAKGDFLARMSHEMRTPLNAVIGMGQLLREEARSPEQAERVEILLSSARNLLHLIEELLDSVTAELAVMAAHKRLELLCWAEPGVPGSVIGDFRRVRQMLLNLGSNAVKYTQQGQVRIRLDWRPEGELRAGQLVLEVEDTGPGIPAGKIPLIFERFTRLEAETGSRVEGVGLGLAVVRELAQRMGGEVTVSSQIGRGSRFSVTVPLLATETQVGAREPNLPAPVWILTADPARARCAAALLSRLAVQTELFDSPRQAVSASGREGGQFPGSLLVWSDELGPREALELAQVLAREPATPPRVFLVGGEAREGSGGDSAEDVVYLPAALSPAVIARALGQGRAEPAVAAIPTPAAPSRRSEGRPRPTSRPRILVAEDNLLNQKVIAGLLRRLGLDCDMASSGREALQALQSQNYDLVLLDISMPEIDGLTTARRIREREAALQIPGIPIVALTAHAYEEDRRRCLEAGMNDFLAMPISLQTLSAVLNRWLPVGRQEGPEQGQAPDDSHQSGVSVSGTPTAQTAEIPNGGAGPCEDERDADPIGRG